MARTLTPVDCYQLINSIAKEACGMEATIVATDSSSFVSVGESILNSGIENTLNALGIVLGRTFMAVRPWTAPLRLINAIDSGVYSNRMRKISFYSRCAKPSGAFNTNLYTNHAMDYDNGTNSGSSVPSMWEQNQPVALELNFGGSSVWDYTLTIYEKQLQIAFRNEAEFASFISGILTEAGNDIECEKAAFNRMTLLNYIAGIYDMNSVAGGAFDLTAGFNASVGQTYTSTQILQAHYTEFMEYFVSTVKWLSRTLRNRSVKYHWSPTKTINGVTYELLRHTPADKQRLILYSKFLIDAEARVLPEIFNDQYLKIENYEAVDFWQNENNPSAISITPAIPDTSDPTEQTVGTPVALDYVVGVLFDEDACMVDYQFDGAFTTPLEARKLYRNQIYHFRKNAINDFTENGVLLYMGAGGS